MYNEHVLEKFITTISITKKSFVGSHDPAEKATIILQTTVTTNPMTRCQIPELYLQQHWYDNLKSACKFMHNVLD
jgi:hypothetical protein